MSPVFNPILTSRLEHVAEDTRGQDDTVIRAGSIAFRDGFAKARQRVIIVAGVPLGTTNTARIAYVGPDSDADM
jgi:pyruvate kinase